jgi:pyruvate dehydrogenase E2 component (dihydrolipoamide acetyltransferase)
VKELKVKEGDIVPVETTLLTLDGVGESKTSVPKAEESAPKAPPTSAPTPSSPAPTASAGGGMEVYPPVATSRVLATPGTRRLAREMSVDINQINGTGIAGRVTREDVLKTKNHGAGATAAGAPQVQQVPHQPQTPPTAAPATTPSKPLPQMPSLTSAQGEEERVALRGIRRKIAEQMQMTKQVVPHFTLMDEVNVTELVRVRQQAKAAAEPYGVKVTYLPFVMKALVATVRDFPMFNASIDDEAQEVVYKKYFNIGFAADTPQGLLVPVVKDVDRKTVLQISQEITDLSQKARSGSLSLDEMKGATITITNIGSVGGTYATPIINHPEVAILGMYKMVDKPVYKDGKFKAAKVMNYTITCDHRLIDGAVAANFLKAFMSRIENPSRLLLEMM